MINRVLIRIKVVQLLYSYLLTEKKFTLESQPTPPTKEKRFAYRLYLDTLVLFTRIAENVQKRGGYQPLLDGRFIPAILADDKIQSTITRDSKAREMTKGTPADISAARDADLLPSPLADPHLIELLSEKVKESDVYKNFLKKGANDPTADIRVWRDLLNMVILPDETLTAAVTAMPEYSGRAVDRMKELMEETFTNFSSSQDHIEDALKELDESLLHARELYFRLLALAPEITDLRDQQLDDARHKYLATEADRNPSLRFVDNEWIKALEDDQLYQEGIKEFKINWKEQNPLLVQNLLKSILSSEVYQDYMASEEKPNWNSDCQLWYDLFRYVVLPNPELAETLEDDNIYWNDDLDFIGTFVLKTVRRFQNGEEAPMLPMYKDEEDAVFGRDLFCLTVEGKDEYRALIQSALKESWEPDRLAFMDVVIMLCAFAEILNFDKIPVSASINEYIEIARAYSTPKSPFFINGVLGGAVSKLRADGRLLKP